MHAPPRSGRVGQGLGETLDADEVAQHLPCRWLHMPVRELAPPLPPPLLAPAAVSHRHRRHHARIPRRRGVVM
eukprot:SAG25_NODE_2621_length_1485_cov_2.831169_1_plen_72_part_10